MNQLKTLYSLSFALLIISKRFTKCNIETLNQKMIFHFGETRTKITELATMLLCTRQRIDRCGK